MTSDLSFRTTNTTSDADAVKVNEALNDVETRIAIGHHLRRLFLERFNGNAKAFRRWVTGNLDASPKSCGRYMSLANNETMLRELGVIDPTAAYRLIGCEGDINSSHEVWQVTP